MQRMSPERDRRHGEELVSRLLRGEAGSGDLENRLLAEFQTGYPLHKLRLLLRAPDEKVVAAAIWIASELGSDTRPLFDDVVSLMEHPSKQVRFFALDCYGSVCTACGRRGSHSRP